MTDKSGDVRDRATRASTEPASSLGHSAGIPSADDLIHLGNKAVLRFHPLKKKVTDGTPRCVSCGQIDEEGWHEADYCPGMGGWIPFPTSTLNLKLRADSGYSAAVEQRLTLEQWVAINRILDLAPSFSREVIALAQAIEARRAETGTGSVHESAVRQDAPESDQP